MNLKRFDPHNHSEYSNIRLLDCINKPEKLVQRAIDIGLTGFCITDHETLSGAIKFNQLQFEIQKDHPEFKIGLGNEIYLTEARDKGQKYYHYILIAKDEIGFKQLKILSSRSWMQSYYDRGLERVPTLKSELAEIVKKEPGHLIATTACLGGELSSSIVEMEKARKIGDKETETQKYNQIIKFLKWNINLFKNDFYLECAPGASKEQIITNKKLIEIAKIFNLKMVIGCDSHYLRKEDRYVHKAYLNSKDGEREIDSFYEYSYMQDEDDIIKNLTPSIVDSYEWMCNNSMEIYDKIQIYNLARNQKVPKVPVKDYPKKQVDIDYPTLKYLYNSDDIYDRYWINECENSLKIKGLDKKEYWDELEYEADIKKAVGDGLGTNVFSYPITLQYYIDLIWECGSPLGAGRGSSMSGLNHYLLNVTQINPIKTGLNFFWRYMNKDRQEMPDIDIDLAPEKRPLILQKIKEERGQRFNKDIDELSRKNLGCTLVATFGTESTKSSVLTSCRGYRSEDCPDGIDVDTAQYLSSLIPQERGALWSLEDVLYGNSEKNRKPVHPFIQEIEKYPGLLDIMLGIQNLINKRSSHASGVIFFDEDPYENCCFMRTPKGEVITQWDLHDTEFAGSVKYDFLVTDIESKIATTINLLQKKELIESNLSLREVYNKYLHPDVLPIDDIDTWRNIQQNNILNLFQFDSLSGSQGIKKVQPKNMEELSATNGLIRLTAGEGLELPMDKYVRYKKNLQLWYDEMEQYGLTKEQQENVTPYFKPYYGVPISQEVLMKMVMDEKICNFSLKEANELRKVLAKKQLQKIPQMKAKIIERAATPQLGRYIWEAGAGPQMSYSFSVLHSTAYSYIGFQTAYLATHWNPIYWNTACIIVNSGSLEEETKEEIVSIYAPEDDDCLYEDLPNRIGKKKIEKTTDYSKLAKAIGDVTSKGIKVSLIDINKSEFSFSPDEENNEILFGLKGVNKIGDNIIQQIIENRPYTGIIDFMMRCHLNKTQMIQLIKSGAFDKTDEHWASKICPSNPRYAIMAYYLYNACEPKTKLNLQNFNGLLNSNLIPETLYPQKQTYLFNKFLKEYKKAGKYYTFDSKTLTFYSEHYDVEQLDVINGVPCILQTKWDKIYQKEMDAARNWLKNNQTELLNQYNALLFNEAWNKYATGTVSAWEMESLCFYYHSHELIDINTFKYGIVNFFDLSYESEVDYWYKRNNKDFPIFKLYKIAGTIISKDNTKASISVLTTTGVVTVKFTKEYYAMFNRQISQVQADGKKKVLEKGWFTRGTKVLITGYRREDTFVAKTYKNTTTHQLYKITNVNGKDISLEHERIEIND